MDTAILQPEFFLLSKKNIELMKTETMELF